MFLLVSGRPNNTNGAVLPSSIDPTTRAQRGHSAALDGTKSRAHLVSYPCNLHAGSHESFIEV